MNSVQAFNGTMDVKRRFIFLALLLTLSFIFICIGTAGNSWVKKTLATQYGEETVEQGLWKSCSTGGCYDYTATFSWLKACRAMVIISCLFIVLALALAALSYVEPRVKEYMVSTACVCSACAMMIALIVFIAKNDWTNQRAYDFSWTFILAWIGVMLSFVTAIWSTIMSRLN